MYQDIHLRQKYHHVSRICCNNFIVVFIKYILFLFEDAVDHEGRQQLGNSEINDQEADNLGTRIVETVKVPVRIVYRVIYYASPQALPTPVNLNSRTQFQSQDQNFNKGVLTQKQYQSGNSQSQHQHQNQNSVSMQQYPTMSPTIRQQMKPNILPNRQEWPERTTATNKELNEKQFASEAYLPPSTTPRTTKLWSTTQETRTQYFPKPSAPQQNYRPYPAPKVQTEIPQRSVEKTTTELNEKPPVDMSTVMKNPTRKIVFPDGDHHELEIDASYMPDYLNLNKKRKLI